MKVSGTLGSSYKEMKVILTGQHYWQKEMLRLIGRVAVISLLLFPLVLLDQPESNTNSEGH